VSAESVVRVRVGAEGDVAGGGGSNQWRAAAGVGQPGGRQACWRVKRHLVAQARPLVAQLEEAADASEDAHMGQESRDAHGAAR
jgi:hypothetical protein